jgi:ATP-binding cassette subfamily B protein
MELLTITRAHGLEDKELEKANVNLNDLEMNGRKIDNTNAIFGSLGFTIFQGVQLVCLVFCSYLALHKQITIGEVTLFQTYFVIIVNGIIASLSYIPVIAKGLESLSSISEVLLCEDEEDMSGTIKVDDLKGNVSFKQVSYKYPDGKNYALSNFSLEIKEGEQIAIVGESGSGKSTLLSLLLGFMNPTEGKIFIEGKDICLLDKHSYRKNIAVVQQNTILFSGTIQENILYGVEHADEKEIQNAVEVSELATMVNDLPEGMQDKVNEHGNNFSGGQKQRISIARAIMRNAKIVILDEATSALDSITEQKIQINLKEKLKGKTRFVVTHRLATIKEADKIVVMKNGMCVESGTFDELMNKNGEFFTLVNKQRV